MPKFIFILIRLKARAHSLNKKKICKDCFFCFFAPKADQVAKSCWFVPSLDDGPTIEPHQKSVFNDPLFKKPFWISLCLDCALCAEGQVVDQDTNEGSHHFSRHPWAIPCPLQWWKKTNKWKNSFYEPIRRKLASPVKQLVWERTAWGAAQRPLRDK